MNCPVCKSTKTRVLKTIKYDTHVERTRMSNEHASAAAAMSVSRPVRRLISILLSRGGVGMLVLDKERVDTLIDIDQAITKRRQVNSTEDLKKILSNVWWKSIREALISTISILGRLSGSVTRKEISIIEQQVARILRMSIDEAKRRKLISIKEAAYQAGMKAGVAESEVSIT